METFKARLVAKGYSQHEDIDYQDTFSLVAMLKSIRILLAVVAYFDYEIWQMDVKTAFLNGINIGGNLEYCFHVHLPYFIIKNRLQ